MHPAEYLKLLSAQNRLLESYMYARTSAIALALLPYPTPVILASLACSNFFIPSGDQDSDSFYNALLNKTLPKDPYDEWSDFARVSRLLKALLAARLLE